MSGAKDMKDAAALLAAAEAHADTVKDATQRSFVEMYMTLGAASLATLLASPFGRHMEKKPAAAVIGFIATALFAGLGAPMVRRRHNLGGAIGTSTWIAAAAIFVATACGFLFYGDPRVVAFSLLPVIGIGVGVLQRNALVVIAVGDFTISAVTFGLSDRFAVLGLFGIIAWSYGILALRGKVIFDK